MMNSRLHSVIFVIIQLTVLSVLADISENSNVAKNLIHHGKYIKRRNEGRYIPMDDRKYIHVHDMREKGKYIHIPYPYDGGYGPYDGHNIPYDYTGDYSFDKFETVSKPNDPFANNEYDIPRPDIYLQYGFPEFSLKQDETNQLPQSSVKNSEFITNIECEFPHHNTAPPQSDIQTNTEIITEIPIPNQVQVIQQTVTDTEHLNTPIPEIPNDIHKRIRKSIFDYSQTQNLLPMPTPRPRRRYDDEGKWKIIRQDENKKETNYEYLYETENGILAEEQAIVGRDADDNSGTNGKGYYQYIGDDDRIYRVEYTVGEQGFVPKLIFPMGRLSPVKPSN